MINKTYIISGMPGSGKSTYGKKLAQELKATILDSDVVTERLVKLSLKLLGKSIDDRDSKFFKENFREEIYNQVFEIAFQNLKINNVVIIAPFTKEIQNLNWIQELEKRLNSNVEVHYIYCSSEIIKERLIKRNNPRDKSKLDNWDKYLEYHGSDLKPVFSHKFIDNSQVYE